jgi:hypothetical protein
MITATCGLAPKSRIQTKNREKRVIHAMSGSMTVDLQEKWMVQLSATLIRPVGFRFGVLGHLDKDGSVSL